MPMLLEDLAEETSASMQRSAARLDAEARELQGLRLQLGSPDLSRRALESARQSTDHVLSRLAQAEDIWRATIALLRMRGPKETELRSLESAAAVFASGQRLIAPSCELWRVAVELGAKEDRLADLESANQRLDKLAREACGAIDHRIHGWQPADPERFALGLRQAQEGKTVKAEEAISRFRQPKS